MESDPYLHSSFTLLSNFLLFIVWNDFYYLLTLVLLLLCSGLFSGSEIAMFSLSHDDLEEIQEHDTPQISALTYLKSHTKRLLALILICNTFVNIGIALVVEQILEHWLPVEKSLAWSDQIISWFSIFSFSREQLASFLYFLIAVVGATTLILFLEKSCQKYMAA